MKNSCLKYLFVVFLLMYTTAVFAERVEINGIPYDVIVKAKQAKVLNSSLENSIGISSTAALVTSNNGVITVDCSLDGKIVAVYTSAGVLIDEVTIKNGNAIVQTSLSKGSVAIVKIGEKSVKVVVD